MIESEPRGDDEADLPGPSGPEGSEGEFEKAMVRRIGTHGPDQTLEEHAAQLGLSPEELVAFEGKVLRNVKLVLRRFFIDRRGTVD